MYILNFCAVIYKYNKYSILKKIYKNYFNIFFKYNFIFYNIANIFKFNMFIFKKIYKLGKHKLFFIYWSFYFNQLKNIVDLFYFINYNNYMYYFLNSSNNSSIEAINWANKKYNYFLSELNIFKLKLINFKKINYIKIFKRLIKKYKIKLLIIFDIFYSNFFFNFLQHLKINLINICSLNINFLNILNYSNSIFFFKNINFFKNILLNIFYDIFLLAKLNKYFYLYRKFLLFKKLIKSNSISI